MTILTQPFSGDIDTMDFFSFFNINNLEFKTVLCVILNCFEPHAKKETNINFVSNKAT